MEKTVTVDPKDLYTILRIFYEAESHYTQAEQRAANRLNEALRNAGWKDSPRKSLR